MRARIYKEDYKMAFTASDIKKGKTFLYDGNVYKCLDFQHVKPGKGAAFVRIKYRNIMTGATREDAFRPSEKFEDAIIERKEMQYLYEDGGLFYFMDNETYEQVPVNADVVDEDLKFVKENENVTVCFYAGSAFSVEPPLTVVLEITETEPGVKGDTATGATKPATVETGATVLVPLFIGTGEMIKIDTRTGEYLSRA